MTPPTAPPSLSVTPISPTEIEASWEEATDPDGIGVYRLERCMGAGCTGFTLVAVTDQLSYIDPGLTPATLYRYRVSAVNVLDEEGPFSPIEQTVTLAPPPTGLIAIAFAMAAALEPLKAELPDLQVTAFLNPNPTPPSIDLYPADLFEAPSGFGTQMATYWTVRARTTTADSESGQRALLRLLDRGDEASVEEALTLDQSLGGLAQAIAVTPEGVSGYRVYLEDPQGNGSLIGCEWRLEVQTK